MAIRKLRFLGDPVLRQKSEPIENIDSSHEKLAKDMIETMYHYGGIGLAAPQIGVSERLIVLDRDPGEDYGTGAFAIVNPVISSSEGSELMEEGCLSIPEIRDVVKRAERVVVTGLDINGEEMEINTAGLTAKVLQHEIDHLDGLLFIDRLGVLKRGLQVKKWRRIRKELEGAGEG